jgi:hypothetical protein
MSNCQRTIVVLDLIALWGFLPQILSPSGRLQNRKTILGIGLALTILIVGYACLDAVIPSENIQALPQPWNVTDNIFGVIGARRYLNVPGQVLVAQSSSGDGSNETGFSDL